MLLVVVGMASATTASKKKKANNDTMSFRYDVEYIQSIGDGIVSVKVWSYSKRASIAEEQCRKNAVHAVIFKGFAGQGAAQPPICRDFNAYETHKEFFDAFFAESGPWAQYASSMVGDSRESRKVGKAHKVGIVVNVNKKMLRQHLEKAGMARGLASGF